MTTNVDHEASEGYYLIDHDAWRAGYAAHGAGKECPTGNESARRGWLTAKADANR